MLSLYVAVSQGAPSVILRDARVASQHFAVIQGRLLAVFVFFFFFLDVMQRELADILLLCREHHPLYLRYAGSASHSTCVVQGAPANKIKHQPLHLRCRGSASRYICVKEGEPPPCYLRTISRAICLYCCYPKGTSRFVRYAAGAPAVIFALYRERYTSVIRGAPAVIFAV